MIPTKFNKLAKSNKSLNKVRIYKATTLNLTIKKINEYDVSITNASSHCGGFFIVDGN